MVYVVRDLVYSVKFRHYLAAWIVDKARRVAIIN